MTDRIAPAAGYRRIATEEAFIPPELHKMYQQLVASGGVSLENVSEWIKAGCLAVGVGGNLTAGAKKGDYQSITEIGKQFVEKERLARAQ